MSQQKRSAIGGGDIKGDEKSVWIKIQRKSFNAWVNSHLRDRGRKLEDLVDGLKSGENLCHLMEIISGKKLPKFKNNALHKIHQVGNCNTALKFIKTEGIVLVNVGPEDIVDGIVKCVLGLIWTLILRYQINKGKNEKQKGEGKKKLLQWLKKQLKEYGIEIDNFTKDFQDGKALYVLVSSLGTSLNIEKVNDNDVSSFELNKDAIEVANKELDIPALVDPKDVSENPEELSMIAYLSYFQDKAPLTNISSAKIEGLEKAPVPNTKTKFKVTTLDKKDSNIYEKGNDTIEIECTDKDVDFKINDNKDGTYDIEFVAPEKKFKVNVKVKGKPIKGSPFEITPLGKVESKIDPSQCKVSGNGLDTAKNMTDSKVKLSVETCDKDGNKIFEKESKVEVKLKNHLLDAPKDLDVKSNDDGTYDVEYDTRRGIQEIQVLVNGTPVKGSTFKVVGLSTIDPSQTTCAGKGIEEGNYAGEPTDFTITTHDKDGKQKYESDATVKVIVQSEKEKEKVPVKLDDNKDGSYTANYVPKSGSNIITVLVMGQEVDVTQRTPNVVGDVKNDDKLCPKTSTVTGEGVTSGFNEGEVKYFQINAKNKDGTPRKGVEDNFDVEILLEDKEKNQVYKFQCHIAPKKKTGVYDVAYKPMLKGQYKITVKTKDGELVDDSPIYVQVGSQPKLWEIEPSSLLFGNDSLIKLKKTKFNRTKPNDEKLSASVKVDGSKDEIVPTVELSKDDEKTYDVKFKSDEQGPHVLTVKDGDKEVKEISPYSFSIEAPVDLSNIFVEGPGVDEKEDKNICFDKLNFKIQAKDKDGKLKKRKITICCKS